MTAALSGGSAADPALAARLAQVEAGWEHRLAGELGGLWPGLRLVLHPHGAPPRRFLHIVGLFPPPSPDAPGDGTAGDGAEIVTAVLAALAMAADQRGLTLTASPWSSDRPTWARLRAFYRNRGYVNNPDPRGRSRADLIRLPRAPRDAWRLAGPGPGRGRGRGGAVELVRDGAPRTDLVVPLTRRADAPEVLAVLRAAQVLGAAHGPCRLRTAADAPVDARGRVRCEEHLSYGFSVYGDLVRRRVGGRGCVIVPRGRFSRAVMARLAQAAGQAYHLGAQQAPHLTAPLR